MKEKDRVINSGDTNVPNYLTKGNESKDNANNTTDKSNDNASAPRPQSDNDEPTIGGANLKLYKGAVASAMGKADVIGADTKVNYVPTQNVILLRGESFIKKSFLLKDKPQEILEGAVGFRFEVVAFGPDVKNLKIGDIIDIKSAQGLSLRPFIPDNRNIAIMRAQAREDRATLIGHNINVAEDTSKVGGIINLAGEQREPGIIDMEEEVLIVEHFATEDHNISGIIFIIDDVHESKE